MFKIAHEAPLAIMSEVAEVTDYCYALVHLFETHPEYYQHFQDSLKKGRMVLLDNSIFELNEAYDSKEYIRWINKLNPTEYIVPDVFNDFEATKESYFNFFDAGKVTADSRTIGVVQGRTYEELKHCYNFFRDRVNKIAFSFAYKYLLDDHSLDDSKWLPFALGRKELLDDLIDDGIIDYSKPHHILGSSLPFEFRFYNNKRYSFIESIDTSNPVVAGILGYAYHPRHCSTEKWDEKLVDFIDDGLTRKQRRAIMKNINIFRNMCMSHHG